MSEEGAAKLCLKPRKEAAAWSQEHPRRRQPICLTFKVKNLHRHGCTYQQMLFACFCSDMAKLSTVIFDLAHTVLPDQKKTVSNCWDRLCCYRSLTGSCSWFEKEDLNECEEPWGLLLKGMSQDSQCSDWQAVPGFPEFFGKTSCVSPSSEEGSLQEQEVFTTGKKDFPWVPFPSFCKEELLNSEDLSSHQLTQSQINHLHKGQGQADKLSSLPCAAEKTCYVTITDQAKHVVGEDTEAISKPDASPKSCKLTWHGSSVHHLALPQCSAKALSYQQHCRGTAQNSMENGKENHGEELQLQTHQGGVSFGEARCSPAEENPPLASVPQTRSCKEKTENQGEGAPTLDSCPMCLTCFSGTLSQMDIDDHLARCLSESTDDVMW